MSEKFKKKMHEVMAESYPGDLPDSCEAAKRGTGDGLADFIVLEIEAVTDGEDDPRVIIDLAIEALKTARIDMTKVVDGLERLEKELYAEVQK